MLELALALTVARISRPPHRSLARRGTGNLCRRSVRGTHDKEKKSRCRQCLPRILQNDSDPKDVPTFFNAALMREIMPATTGHEALVPSPGVSLPPMSTTKA